MCTQGIYCEYVHLSINVVHPIQVYIYLGDEVPLIICSSSLPPPVLIDPKPGRPHNTATSHTHTPVLSCWITAVKRSQSWSWSLPRRPLLQNHLLHSKHWIACTALTHTHTHAPTYTYLLTRANRPIRMLEPNILMQGMLDQCMVCLSCGRWLFCAMADYLSIELFNWPIGQVQGQQYWLSGIYNQLLPCPTHTHTCTYGVWTGAVCVDCVLTNYTPWSSYLKCFILPSQMWQYRNVCIALFAKPFIHIRLLIFPRNWKRRANVQSL